tara:strand:- start:4094 stop:4393 length:300 start_codon:yes stop_codon:yes gene_type:complete
METNKTKEPSLANQVLRAYEKYCEASDVIHVIFNHIRHSSEDKTKKDILGFIKYIENKKELNINDSYNLIKDVLIYDIIGLVNKEKNFLPRSSGYSKHL